MSLESTPDARQLPWQDRRRIGRPRAAWRQCRLLMRRPGVLAERVDQAVSYSASRRFHLICCVMAWLALAGPAVYGFLIVRWAAMRGGNLTLWLTPPAANPTLADYLLDGLILLAMLAGLFLWLVTATGVPSYFCHPRRAPVGRQDTAVALSYYAAAPLLALPAAVLLVAAMYAASQWLIPGPTLPEEVVRTIAILGGPAFVAIGLYLWLIPALLLRRGVQSSWWRVGAMWLTLAVAWPALFLLWVVGLPLLTWWAQSVFTLAR